MMILLATIFLILGEAVPEALALKKHKTIAGVIEGIWLVVVTSIVYIWLMGLVLLHYGHSFAFVMGGYVLMRFAIFDIIYNLIARLPVFYIGTTKTTDKFWQWFFTKTHFPIGLFFGMLKFICFLIGLTWLLTK